MRADEYVVEQYLELKKENEKLKKELEEALQEKEEVIILEEEKSRNTEVVYLDKTIYEIYYCKIADSYSIKRYITEDDNKYKEERINELKELLETTDITMFTNFEINYGYYNKNYLVAIDEVQCQYKVKYMEHICYLKFHTYNNELSVNTYIPNREKVYEDYEKAKTECILKSIEEIRKAFKELGVKEDDSEIKS